jgi:hypothetical protein
MLGNIIRERGQAAYKGERDQSSFWESFAQSVQSRSPGTLQVYYLRKVNHSELVLKRSWSKGRETLRLEILIEKVNSQIVDR